MPSPCIDDKTAHRVCVLVRRPFRRARSSWPPSKEAVTQETIARVWTARVVLPFVGLFVLLGTAVVIAMLRLLGVIAWPSRWVSIGLLVLLLVPIALLLNAAIRDGDGPRSSLADLFTILLPPW